MTARTNRVSKAACDVPSRDSKLKLIAQEWAALPQSVKDVLAVLESENEQAWLVGGWLRDACIGKASKDIDICYQGPWPAAQSKLEKAGYFCKETGKSFLCISLKINSYDIQVCSFRSEGSYKDRRHPDHVALCDSIEEDLSRRDFTMNALAYHPLRGLIDPYNGCTDIEKGCIRAIGEAKKRFSEDALRILRAVRFSAELGFSIDENTYRAMMSCKTHLVEISVERIRIELEKMLLGAWAENALIAYVDVLSAVLPELVALKDFEQKSPYHVYDVLVHTAKVLAGVPATPLCRWAALLHDLGKPAMFFTDENGQGHFYGHGKVSVALTEGICNRLRFSKKMKADLLKLVEMHDDGIKATKEAISKALCKLDGDMDLFDALCDLKISDAAAHAPQYMHRCDAVRHLKAFAHQLKDENELIDFKSLAIDGNDLQNWGIKRGPAIKKALDDALHAVNADRVENTFEALHAYFKNYKK